MAHVVKIVLQFIEPLQISDDEEVVDLSPATAETQGVWEEVVAMFGTGGPVLFGSESPPRPYAVTVVADHVLDYFRLGGAGAGFEALEDRCAQLEARYGPGIEFNFPSGVVEFHFTAAEDGGSEVPPPVVRQFLDQFWLAFNLALPGAFDLDAAENAAGARDGDEPPPLRAAPFWDAFAASKGWHWPPLRRLPFRQVWDWLHADMLYDLVIAKSPSQKALTNLLLAAQRAPLDPANVVSVAQAIESLIGPRAPRLSISETLRRRLRVLFGLRPENEKRWNAFYKLRSDIAHGTAPIWRPQHRWRPDPQPDLPEHAQHQRQLMADGLSVLLALLQDLIAADARAYRFSSTGAVTRVR